MSPRNLKRKLCLLKRSEKLYCSLLYVLNFQKCPWTSIFVHCLLENSALPQIFPEFNETKKVKKKKKRNHHRSNMNVTSDKSLELSLFLPGITITVWAWSYRRFVLTLTLDDHSWLSTVSSRERGVRARPAGSGCPGRPCVRPAAGEELCCRAVEHETPTESESTLGTCPSCAGRRDPSKL